MKNQWTNWKKVPKHKLEKNNLFQCVTFENAHKGPCMQARKFAISGTFSLSNVTKI